MTSTVPVDGSPGFRLGKPRPTNPGLKRIVDMMNPSGGCRAFRAVQSFPDQFTVYR